MSDMTVILQEKFDAYTKKADDKLKKAVLKCALKIERDAKLKFKGKDEPSVKDEPPRVQTGRFRSSITHKLNQDAIGTYAEIGTNVDYAYKQEFGSSTNWPHPVLTPTLEENKDFIRETMREGMQE